MHANAQMATHSDVLVPLIIVAMGEQHPSLRLLHQRFGFDVVEGAIHEIKMILPRLASQPRIDVRQGPPPYPYISAADQEAVLELTFLTYLGVGHFQDIQTIVALGIAPGRLTRYCCDAPHDATCRVTGLAHATTCATCNQPINDSQPFCSRQVPGSMIKCSPADASSSYSPFDDDDQPAKVPKKK